MQQQLQGIQQLGIMADSRAKKKAAPPGTALALVRAIIRV